jgi:hypothetical protein
MRESLPPPLMRIVNKGVETINGEKTVKLEVL